jgi:hypothetical protein
MFQKKVWLRYSGSTRGFRALHWILVISLVDFYNVPDGRDEGGGEHQCQKAVNVNAIVREEPLIFFFFFEKGSLYTAMRGLK